MKYGISSSKCLNCGVKGQTRKEQENDGLHQGYRIFTQTGCHMGCSFAYEKV